MKRKSRFTWHGHRGCRGLLPENSIPAFVKAIDLGMDALEMDVVISKDHEVVIAHEPFMPADICSLPNGDLIDPDHEKEYNLYQMDYEDIAKYNCGLKHPRFEEQASRQVHRPLLTELFNVAEAYCKQRGIEDLQYTIELKSLAKDDGVYHPSPKKYVELVLAVIEMYGLGDRCVLQSFDYRILQEIRRQEKDIELSMLITDEFVLNDELESLGFVPEILGPRFQLVTAELIQTAHDNNMRIVPWTINEVEDMKRLIALGVDGIITDYPDRKALAVV